jgi:hypothetical protein
MQENEILNKLNSLICEELNEIEDELGGNRMFNLLELAKCIDHCFVAHSFVIPIKAVERTRGAILYQQFTTAWYDLLKLVMPEDNEINLCLKVRSNREQIIFINSLFQRAGNVGNLKRLIALKLTTDLVKCSLNKTRIKFKIEGRRNGAELYEAEQQRKLVHGIYNSKIDLLISEEDIFHLLNGNVYSKDLINIEYNKNIYIDDYYKGKGEVYASALIGYDSFSDESIFNGIEYGDYKKIVILLIGRCLKHLDYCFHYQKKTGYQIVNPWDTYPQAIRKEQLINELSVESKLNPQLVEFIIYVLCLNKEKLERMNFQPGYAPPPIIQFGSGSVLLSMMGNLSNPFVYLNKCLHKLFDRDRQIAASSREDMFKRQLYDVFSDELVKIPGSLKIKDRRKDLTDIDAVIFDEKNQTLFLIQIKWMDDWGTDMYQRSSMKKNYKDKVEKWLKTVDNYIMNKGKKHLFNSLKLNIWSENTVIHYVILGKHFSQFSDYTLPSNALAVNWAGLLSILKKNPQFCSSLKLLAEFMKSNYFDKEVRKLRSRIKPMDINLRGNIITIANATN